uniref:Uncharacterized protein n=1 Tax=Plectus sambesii TaxID=2011161 RepID=A0A914V6I6_9BILA
MVCLLLVAPALALASLDMDAFSPDLFAKDELTELYARDSEKVGGPIAFGHKFMTGGAGEGNRLAQHADREEVPPKAHAFGGRTTLENQN